MAAQDFSGQLSGGNVEDINMTQVIASLKPEEVISLYKMMHSPAAEYVVAQYRGNTDGVNSTELSMAMSDKDMNAVDMLYERFSPGELMMTYDVLHNSEIEHLFEDYNKSALAFLNDPVTNSAALETLSRSIYDYQDDLFDDERGLNDEEKKQKRKFESVAAGWELVEEFEQEQEKKRAELQAKWDAGNVHVTVAGIDLTSGQIDNILNMWSDPKKQKQLIEDFSKEQNISKEDAKDKLAKAMLILEVIKKRERGEQLTKEEEKLYLQKDDPEYAETIEFVKANEEKVENKNNIDHTTTIEEKDNLNLIEKNDVEQNFLTKDTVSLENQNSVRSEFSQNASSATKEVVIEDLSFEEDLPTTAPKTQPTMMASVGGPLR